MKLKVIITGATGMVGEGVLLECLENPDVEKILLVGRKPYGISHPKTVEILHDDFFDVSAIADRMRGYDACYFCLGISSVGMKEEEFYSIAYTLTMSFARKLAEVNPDMTFCYVSGAGTDSTEKGRMMWARVKGKTENDLLKLPFKAVYNFRPGFLRPTSGAKNSKRFYAWLNPFFPVFRFFFPRYFLYLKELAIAMIHVSVKGYDKQILEAGDIKQLAEGACAGY